MIKIRKFGCMFLRKKNISGVVWIKKYMTIEEYMTIKESVFFFTLLALLFQLLFNRIIWCRHCTYSSFGTALYNQSFTVCHWAEENWWTGSGSGLELSYRVFLAAFYSAGGCLNNPPQQCCQMCQTFSIHIDTEYLYIQYKNRSDGTSAILMRHISWVFVCKTKITPCHI